jgi:hypothetical protein
MSGKVKIAIEIILDALQYDEVDYKVARYLADALLDTYDVCDARQCINERYEELDKE